MSYMSLVAPSKAGTLHVEVRDVPACAGFRLQKLAGPAAELRAPPGSSVYVLGFEVSCDGPYLILRGMVYDGCVKTPG